MVWILNNTSIQCYNISKVIPFLKVLSNLNWLLKSFRALQTCLLRERYCLVQNKRLDLIQDKTGQWSTQWECYNTCKHSTGSQWKPTIYFMFTNKLEVLWSYRKSILYVLYQYLISQWFGMKKHDAIQPPTVDYVVMLPIHFIYNRKGSNYIHENTLLWISIHFNSIKYHMHYTSLKFKCIVFFGRIVDADD